MVNKKIKKSSSTITGVVMIILITMGLFFVMFTYMKNQADQSGIEVPQKYNDTFTRLEQSQEDMDNNVNAIKGNVTNVKEADNSYQVAVNGFKALGNTLKLTVNFVGAAIDTTSAILIPLDFIPTNIKNLITIGLIAVVIFIVLSVLKGDPKLIQ